MRGKYVSIDKDILLKTYEECGRSMHAASKILNTSSKTIMRRLKEYGIDWDKKIFYQCNDNFFDYLNEKSLYWLGFLATDGCVAKHNYSYTINLKLATKDKDHLILFKNNLNADSPISDSVFKKNNSKFKKNEYYSSSITITSKKMFDKLSEFNIVPNKTHIYKFPEQLKNHPDVRHFIRGCLDGDGWWRKHKNNGKNYTTEIRVGMCGTPKFVKEMFDIIKEKNNIDSGSYYVRKSGNTADFEFYSKKDVNKIFNYLYKDSSIYLLRKYEIAAESANYL